MSGFVETDSHPEDDPDSLRREEAALHVARAVIAESVRGVHFDRYEDDVQTLRRLHSRVQFLKSTGPLQGGNALAEAREERLKQAGYVAELLADAEQTTFPKSLTAALAQYRAAVHVPADDSDALLATHETYTSEHPSEYPDSDETSGGNGDRPRVHIHGLEAIPACGAPLPSITMRKLPETLLDRAKDQVDNADYWYSEHRRTAIVIGGAVAALLLMANLAAIVLVARYESDYVPAVTFVASSSSHDPTPASVSEAVAQPAAAKARLKNQRYLLIHMPILALLAGLLAGVFYRSHLSKLDFARRYSLRMVKAILTPVDVSISRSLRPFYGLRFYEDPPPDKSARPKTVFERRVRIAQVAALALLASMLTLPPVVQAVRYQDFSDQTGAGAANAALSANTGTTGAENPDDQLRIQIRSQYTKLTAIIVLIILVLIIIYAFRRLHQASDRYVQGINATFVSKAVASTASADFDSNVSYNASADYAIDHENPFGAMAKKIADNAKEISLAKKFRIEAMIAWYRIFNKWRVLKFFVGLLDGTLRFMGVIVFGALLLLSVVMPLIVLSVFQEKGDAAASGIRSLAKEYFPELYQENPTEQSGDAAQETVASTIVKDAEGGHLSLEVRPQQETPPANPWALPYALFLTGVVVINLFLLGLRLFARRKAGGVVSGTNWRLTAEIACSSLVLVGVLWLWDSSPGYAKVTEVQAQPEPLAYREPAIVARIQELTEEKTFSQFFLPESASAVIFYVDARSPGPAHDGRSWNTAFLTMEEGIVAAALSGGGEVWVAANVYRPRLFTTDSAKTSMAFGIPNNVHVFGGFAGASPGGHETSRLERNWKTHRTFLDLRKGDAEGNLPIWLYGSGRWTLDGVVVVGGRILGESAAARSGEGPRLRGVIGNTTFVFPVEPVACTLGSNEDRIFFHHSALFGAEGLAFLGLQSCAENPGVWAVLPPMPRPGPVKQLAPAPPQYAMRYIGIGGSASRCSKQFAREG